MKSPFELLLPYQKKIFLDDNPFCACLMSRQSGKSFTIAAKAVYKSITTPNNLTVIVSVNQRSADELLRKVKNWALACKTFSNLVDFSENASSVTFNNGSRVISLPANPASLRGWSGDVILDEFAMIENDEEIFQAVLPVITSKMTGKQKTLTICSTPTSLDTQFSKIWHTNDSSWSKHRYTIYECVEKGLKADPELLKQIVNDDLVFQTEYMCEFASGAGTAFPNEWLTDISYDELPSGGKYYLGFDVARHNDFSALVVCYAKDKDLYVVDIVKLKDTNYSEQLKVVQNLNNKYKFFAGFTDACGIGNMIAEEIQRSINPKIKGYTWNGNNKTILHDNLRTLIQNRNFHVYKELVELVKNDFANVRRYISSTGKISYSAPHSKDGHSDITSGIVLGLEAIRQNPVTFSNPQPGIYSSRLNSWHSRL